jgi:hypothetical protein
MVDDPKKPENSVCSNEDAPHPLGELAHDRVLSKAGYAGSWRP